LGKELGMNTPAMEDLQRAAKSGDVAAMTALGIRLLAGRGVPMSPFDGAQLIADAAAKGDAEAAGIVGTLAGVGACTPQSWPLAFDYLQLAAERGWPQAQAQLALLASDKELAAKAKNGGAPADAWRRLRESVDIAAWTNPPPLRVISEKPYLATFENFVPPALCDWLIERARPNLKPARVYDDVEDSPRLANSRTNSSAEFDIVDTDIVLALLRARIAAVTGYPAANLEYTSVLHYKVGEQFRRHFDFLDPAQAGPAADLARRGQRATTLLIYLNEGYEAGETEFPLIDVRYKGQKGGALHFSNVEPSGAPDRQTLHAGLAPARGEKWLLSQWVRDRG
jgi:prolyl 4-hydroxylase